MHTCNFRIYGPRVILASARLGPGCAIREQILFAVCQCSSQPKPLACSCAVTSEAVVTLPAICSEAGGLDFTEGFKRYLHFEASFLLSCFFFFFFPLILGLWEIFHLSSSPEINLSLELFLTTKEDLGPPLDEFAKGGGGETEKEEEKKAGVRSGTGAL